MADSLAELNQAAAAALMQVDRTTIRAWTAAGMPYTPPTERGKEASYRTSVLIQWAMWRRLRDELKFTEQSPVRALAIARASMESDEHAFRESFPKMVSDYFPIRDAHEATGYALAFVQSNARRGAK
ncbi:MAG: hypothetical protein ABIQ70_07065 [Dokdonella sp.]